MGNKRLPPLSIEGVQEILLGEDMIQGDSKRFGERDAVLYRLGTETIIRGIVVNKKHFPEGRQGLGFKKSVPVLLERNPSDIEDGEWRVVERNRLEKDGEPAPQELLNKYNRKAAAHMLPQLDRRVVQANIK